MPLTCDITFENSIQGIYSAGEYIIGKVVLQTEKVKKVKGLTVEITGSVHTKCLGDGGARIYGERDYIAGTAYLLGSKDCADFKIAPGLHTYKFVCGIPENFPASFEASSGYIRYVVTVTLLRPWKFEQTFKEQFTVSNPMKLSYDSLSLPVTSGLYKTFRSIDSSSNFLMIDVTLPQKGYEIGQFIPVNVLITNESNVEINSLEISLVQHVRYSSNLRVKYKIERSVVTKVNGEGAVPHACAKNQTYELIIPETSTSSVDLCRILKIYYQLEVLALLNGKYNNEVVALPVVIGKMPLKCDLIIEGSIASAQRISRYTESCIPPPTYDEAVCLK